MHWTNMPTLVIRRRAPCGKRSREKDQVYPVDPFGGRKQQIHSDSVESGPLEDFPLQTWGVPFPCDVFVGVYAVGHLVVVLDLLLQLLQQGHFICIDQAPQRSRRCD